MAIDPSSIQWDEAPQIDPAGVTWDDAPAQVMPEQAAQVATEPVSAAPAPQAGRFGSLLNRLPPNAGKELMQGAGNLLGGAVRGAGSIGATLVAPYDIVQDLRAGKGLSLDSNRQRRADMDWALQDLGAQPDSMAFKGGKLGAEIAGTAGAGGLIARGASMLPGAANIAPLIESIGSGGFRAGGMQGLSGLATRAAGGAIAGGASAGLVNPEDAGLGAMVGGAVPAAAAIGGNTMRGIGRAIRGGEVSPEVAALAQKAEGLGIQVPGDRVVNSKPLNALAASLEYMPLSGRTATLDKMQGQLNRAVSRTFGQDSDNVTMALRKAQGDLGAKFDTVLQSNKVKVDDQFLSDLLEHGKRANNELESSQASIIHKQIEEIVSKSRPNIDKPSVLSIKTLPNSRVVDVKATTAELPPVKGGHVRLYRAESPSTKFDDVFDSEKLKDFASELEGARFTPDLKYADYYRSTYGPDAVIKYIDIPQDAAAKVRINGDEYALGEDFLNGTMKGEPVAIEGQAAYNIKKTLDRIGQRNSPEAYYANDLKRSLMGALNRSLDPVYAADFAKVRQQYGTMLDLKKMAQNGADGDISIARLANMKNIGNPELQDLADISAQFLKAREGQHGAMQRVVLGGLGAAGAGSGMVSPLLFGGAMAAGRGANAALNSNALKSLLMRAPSQGPGLLSIGAEKANKVLPLLAPQLLNAQ